MTSARKPEYQLSWTLKDGYLHFVVTGENSPDAFSSYTDDVVNYAKKMECRYALIEDRLTGPRMSAMELYATVPDSSRKAAPYFEAIALIDTALDQSLEFAETIAVNRGLQVAIFNDFDEARAWLLQQMDAAQLRKLVP